MKIMVKDTEMTYVEPTRQKAEQAGNADCGITGI